ncbi:BamA/TamA family outer membrane protein [Massilia sp. H-1]|nr:BamA/TamA family outer membrane protein [Massilia sp. H-1]
MFRLSQTRDNLIVNERPVATYTIRQHSFGLDFGRHIDNTTTLRFGVERGSSRASPSVAVQDFATQSDQIAVIKMDFLQDRLDDWVFPTTGTFAFANARISS